jgi:3-hydroxyacyl-CoA dehydrogenase
MMDDPRVKLTRDGDVAVITIDNPPVNALSPGVPEAIAASVEQLRGDAALRGAVLIGAGRTFIAGADIREFEKLTQGRGSFKVEGLTPLLATIEDCPKPIVCAIHGSALGGGLEVAMACHYRVAVSGAQVGQPEVKLGIIPGAGGTQRLPRLVGVARAAVMCAAGDPVPAPEACRWGLIDRIVEGNLIDGAKSFLRERIRAGGPPRKTRELGCAAGSVEDARALAAKKMKSQTAPLVAIELVASAARLPFDEGILAERRAFQECLYGEQSRALVHVFFAERQVRKVPGLGADVAPLEIRRAAVVGAGTMGSGIATAYANAGIPVALKEATQERLDHGRRAVEANFASAVKSGRISRDEADRRLALVSPTLSYEPLREADIVVEAVFEEMELKERVFAELDGVAREGAILASNTSTLDIDRIAAATRRPEWVIGNHFFSPAHVMKLLEIVRGARTSPAVIATSMELAKRLGKVGVLVGNGVGFVGNRMFHPYMREAEFVVEEGATVAEVDQAMADFGMAMGPLAVGDLAGLDVGWRVRKEHRHRVPHGMRTGKIADALCERGRFGQKTGAGWYRYDPGERAGRPDPEVEALARRLAHEHKIPQRTFTAEQIVERIVDALINEGARVLEEKLALRASDIDIVYLYGYGFPAYRGGPMWHADTAGLKKICDRLAERERTLGFWWKPSGLLATLAREGRTFAELDRRGDS